MNHIINQLSQIEEKTSAILDGAAVRKKDLAASYEEASRNFDEQLNRKTESTIQNLRHQMEADAAAQLEKQKVLANERIADLEKHYNKQHSRYVDSLFHQMIEV